MGKHSKTVLAETSIPDSQVDGLTWDITVTPDTDCTDGLDMYEDHGHLWRWVIVTTTPVIDGHAYAGAHGGTVGWGHMRNREGFMVRESIEDLMTDVRWYTYEPCKGGSDWTANAKADRYEIIPPIVPVLIEQARESLPDVISRHCWEALAVADKITDLVLGEWTDDQDDEPADTPRAGWAERALAEAVEGAQALAEPEPGGGPHHGQVVVTLTLNVPYETSETDLVAAIENALEGAYIGHDDGGLENVDVRDIEDARTVYDSGTPPQLRDWKAPDHA